MTRFTSLTRKPVLFNFRFPLVFFQLLQMILTITVCINYCTLFCSSWERHNVVRSWLPGEENVNYVNPNNSLNFGANVDDDNFCARMSKNSSNSFVRKIGSALSLLHHSVERNNPSFNDIFGSGNFAGLTLYMYACVSLVYICYLSYFPVDQDFFPIRIAYIYWKQLIGKALAKPNRQERLKLCRRIMTLTSLDWCQFIALRKWKWIDSFFCCNGVYKYFLKNRRLEIVNGLSETGPVLQNKLADCHFHFRNHAMKEEFRKMFELMKGDEENEKLFLYFVVKFDQNLTELTSYRIKSMFKFLDIVLDPERIQ